METFDVKKFNPGDNPIKSIDGKPFPYAPSAPNGFKFTVVDVSAKDANRTEDPNITMHKKCIGQVEDMALNFNHKTFEETHEILKIFNKEYILLEYANPLAGGFVTQEMYMGSRHADMIYGGADIWGNISITLKSRKGGKKNYIRTEG